MRVTPTWEEPLVLWQAVVGEPSTGKSAALAPMHRLLDLVEQSWRSQQAEPSQRSSSPQFVTTDASPESLAEVVAGNPRGVMLLRDGPREWLGDTAIEDSGALWLTAWAAGSIKVARPRKSSRSLARFPVSILETIRPERLKASLRRDSESLATRFLFVWPGPQPYRSLIALEPSRDEELLQRLKALARLAQADNPFELRFDANGLAVLESVSSVLYPERLKAEGLEAAWLGRGRTFIARLAGAFELLASVDGGSGRPGLIGSARVEAAAKLWRDYYWPHARAVFDGAHLSEHRRRVRRVARWLRTVGAENVSREDIRRRALSQSATADETDRALLQLHKSGYVQPDRAYNQSTGRPPNRWQVNPMLAKLKHD